MPEMDGFRLLEVIRSRSESLPVILVTARSSPADRARAEALGATAYVTKGDFQSESLVNVVKRLLAEEK
jgi:two-component system chemotaxis sensor kinase CheA